MIDVNQQINAVRRKLGKRVLEAGEARVQTISQVYDTTLEDLWEATTKPERIARWFLPITGDLQVGGRYQLEGNAGGTVERCDPPKGFAATWEYGSEVSWIEVRLTSEPTGGTRFELEHIAHVNDELWAQFGPGATGVGWDLGLIGLDLYLASGGETAVDPAAVAAWSASDEGRKFITLSSQRWSDEAVAAGDDPAAARAAAERTTAFYTTPPEAAEAEAPAGS